MTSTLLMLFLAVLNCSSLSAKDMKIEAPSNCSFSGNFEQSKSLRGLETAIESSGIFFFDCNLGVIWKTLLPVEETLVLNKVGQGSRIEQSQVFTLKSRQGRLLGKLINGLMGADSEFIEENFNVQSTRIAVPSTDSEQTVQRQSHVLNPKKSRLRRAIKRIELVIPVLNDNPQYAESEDHRVTISLLDRNDQWTHIISREKANYSLVGGELGQCTSAKLFEELECDLLEQSHAN